MKATGVLRRIDNLGRIVIPKEIRKNLKIRDGESLEIFTESDSIILKKHSLMNNIKETAKICVDLFNEFVNANIVITDRNTVIAASGSLKKKYLDKEISETLVNALMNREVMVENQEKALNIDNEGEEKGKYIIAPIIADGDAVGLVILLLDNKEIKETDEKVVHFMTKFLSKQIE